MLSDVSIRTKIALAAALATVCLLSLVGALGFRQMVDATRQAQIDLLNEQLDAVERQLETDDRTVARSTINSSIRIVRAGGDLPPPVPGTLQVTRSHDSEDIHSIVGLADTTRIDATLSTIRVTLWISVAIIGLLVGLAAWLVVGRALAPVRTLTAQAEENMASRSMEPVSIEDGHGEIAQLATTFNTMLGRLRSADEDRRRFVSDASHELRTPLMVLGADAEYAIKHGGSDGELAPSVLAQSKRLTSLVDDLLLLASLDETERTPLGIATVHEVVRSADVASLWTELDRSVGGLEVPDVSRSLSNIVANARRHAEDQVDVRVERQHQMVRFVVDDDGSGVPPDERDNIFRRFYRPDHDRNREGGGAGLGLAIARTEALRADGFVWVEDSPLGGARFVLAVPVSS